MAGGASHEKKDEAAAAAASISASAAASTAPTALSTEVELLDAGSDPKSPIVVTLEPGVTQRVVSRTESKVEQTMGGKTRDASPPDRVGEYAGKVSTIGERGAFVTIEYGSPALAEGEAELGAALDESILRVLVTPRAAILQAGARGPALKIPKARQALTQASTALVTRSWPLPKEPVGVGARWRVTAVRPGALVIREILTLELVERTADRIELDVKGKLEADPQPYRVPAWSMKLDRMEGTVEGSRTILLDKPFFLGKTTSVSRRYATASKGGEQQKVVTVTKTTQRFMRPEDAAATPAEKSGEEEEKPEDSEQQTREAAD